MKITNIEVIPVAIPFHSPYVLSYAVANPHSVFVKMTTDTGHVGWGEAAAMPESHGSHISILVSEIREVLAPPLIGVDPRNIRMVHEVMDRAIFNKALARQAKAAIDIAAYDVAGKALGVPVSTLLGGALRDKIRVYGSSEGVGSKDDAAKLARDTVAKGFRDLKMKGSQDPWTDVPRIAAMREAVGNDINLRLDPNEGYRTADEALPALKEMEKYNLTLIEQPLPRHDLHGYARLCAALHTPVVIHQGIESPQDAVQLIRMGAGDVFNIAVQIVGGLYHSIEILAIAENFGIPVLVGSTRELAIGDAASAHFASIIRHLPYACDCRFHMRYVEDVADKPLRIDEGHIYVPQTPGLGVNVDEEKIRKYRLKM